MNILVTLNRGYLRQLLVMLVSLCENNHDSEINLYVMHNSFDENDFKAINAISSRLFVKSLFVEDDFLKEAPTTARYPREMYFRLFAFRLLPKNVEKILYLDPDIVIINSLKELYQMELGDDLIAAASHIKETGVVNKLNELRLNMPQGTSYVNSGVMIMNIAGLRNFLDESEVFDFIKERRQMLILPDQDVLNGILGDKILGIDALRYNLSDRILKLYNIKPQNLNNKLKLDWVTKNTKIVHYCGRNKPWNEKYLGKLQIFYKNYETIAISRGIIKR